MVLSTNKRLESSRASSTLVFSILVLPLILLALCAAGVQAGPVTVADATTAAQNWLAMQKQPLGTDISHVLREVRTFSGDDGTALYYVVSLDPSGYIIVSADNLVEPIIAFSPDGDYQPDPDNPMYSLVANDLRAREEQAKAQQVPQDYALPTGQLTPATKWNKLLSGTSGVTIKGLSSISDPRVDPFVLSKWSQNGDRSCGYTTYNYYTPSNYACGCVATAGAQLMRYWQYPTNGVGTQSYSTTVCGGSATYRSLRGGDGAGGPYSWGSMPLDPTCPSSTVRQAIGSLCYDVGCAVNMDWCTSSGTDTLKLADAFKNAFGYSSAKKGYNGGLDLTSEPRNRMINANLNAGYPVVLGITDGSSGHAIVCDGYGYNLSTMYHHMNLGWAGSYTAWYNLPTIDAGGYAFNSVYKCVYNVYPSGSGEIIAGRVTDTAGYPIAGATVTATPGGFTDQTDSRGNYALVKVASNTTYTVTVSGCTTTPQTVTTGYSSDYSTTCGNKWPIDFACTPEGWQSSTDIPKTIADNSTVWSTMDVSSEDAVDDVDVKVNITHPYDSDLQVYLQHPDGTLVELFTNVGGSGDNFTNTILDDEATASIATGSAPFTGSFRPEGALSALDTKPAGGTWRLKVVDTSAGSTGTLLSWGLKIATRSLAPIVSDVTSDVANGAYTTGAVIDIKTTFSEPVTVTGSPQLMMETGTVDRAANYIAGSGTNVLTFRYVVQSGDTSPLLSYVGTGSLALNGGTIKNGAGAAASLLLPVPGISGSLSYHKAIVIDTTPPAVSSITRMTPTSQSTKVQSVVWRVTFTEPVSGVATAAPWDFLLRVVSGGVSGCHIDAVTPAGTTGSIYDIAVDTGACNGEITLDVPNTASISDFAGNAYSSSYTTGATYIIDKTPTAPANPNATNLTGNSIGWTWSDNSSDETAFKVYADAGSAPPTTLRETLSAGATHWDYTGLNANCQYSFQVAATNDCGDSAKSSLISRYTLADPPSYDHNIVCDKSIGSWYTADTTFTVSNPVGFGACGQYKVSKFKYAWTQSSAYTWTGSESEWSAASLLLSPTTSGSFYLHLKSCNGDGFAGPTDLTVGPYKIDVDLPSAPAITDSGAYQTDVTQLSASWAASTDATSGVAEYQYAIGTTPTDLIVGWKTAGMNLNATETGLSLQPGRIYYWYVKVRDGVGNWSSASTSDGVYIVTNSNMSVSAAKLLPDDAYVGLDGKVVTAVTDTGFYVQDDAPWAGIKIAPAVPSSAPSVGARVDIGGKLATNFDGERQIVAIMQVDTETATPHAVGLTNRALGGTGRDYVPATGQGQQGIEGGVGLNNVGMLVRTWGKLVTGGAGTFQAWTLDSSPNWSTQGEWAFGTPRGLGGASHGHPDPTSGHTGENVYGVNLNGDYSTTSGGPWSLRLGPINCSGRSNVTLAFWRWLNTDYQPYAYATVQVSSDGTQWTTVWTNGTSQVADAAWQLCSYSIASVADNRPTVYIKWDYRVGGNAYAYSGWNIDDVELSGSSGAYTLSDGSGDALHLAFPAGMTMPPPGSYLSVTGICTCVKDEEGKIRPTLQVTSWESQ